MGELFFIKILILTLVISALFLTLLQISLIDWISGEPRKTLKQYSILISLLRVNKCWKVKGDNLNHFIVFKNDSFLTIAYSSNYVKNKIFYIEHIEFVPDSTNTVIYPNYYSNVPKFYSNVPKLIDPGVCFISNILFSLAKNKMYRLSKKSETLEDTSILNEILKKDVIQRQRDKKIKKIID